MLNSEFENFKYYCKNNEIFIANSEYSERIVCLIELEEQKAHKLLEDYATKKINLDNVEKKSKKYITKSIKN